MAPDLRPAPIYSLVGDLQSQFDFSEHCERVTSGRADSCANLLCRYPMRSYNEKQVTAASTKCLCDVLNPVVHGEHLIISLRPQLDAMANAQSLTQYCEGPGFPVVSLISMRTPSSVSTIARSPLISR